MNDVANYRTGAKITKAWEDEMTGALPPPPSQFKAFLELMQQAQNEILGLDIERVEKMGNNMNTNNEDLKRWNDLHNVLKVRIENLRLDLVKIREELAIKENQLVGMYTALFQVEYFIPKEEK